MHVCKILTEKSEDTRVKIRCSGHPAKDGELSPITRKSRAFWRQAYAHSLGSAGLYEGCLVGVSDDDGNLKNERKMIGTHGDSTTEYEVSENHIAKGLSTISCITERLY
jgi:hypothetical protein